MMASVGVALPALGKGGDGMGAGQQGDDSAGDCAALFMDAISKLSGEAIRAEEPAQAEGSKQPEHEAKRPDKRADAPSLSLFSLSPELALAAAGLPEASGSQHEQPARMSRRSIAHEDAAAEPRADSKPAQGIIAAALAVTALLKEEGMEPDRPLPVMQDAGERDPPSMHVDKTQSSDRNDSARAKPEEPRHVEPLPVIRSARQEVHFDTARFGWTMSGPSLPSSAAKTEMLPQQHIMAAPLHLDVAQTSEPLKLLRLEIDPGTEQQHAVTATLRLREDQLEVRLETADSGMAARLKEAAGTLTASLEQGGYRVETVIVQKGQPADNAALLQAAAAQERSGRPRARAGREGRMGDERTGGPRRTRAGGDIIV